MAGPLVGGSEVVGGTKVDGDGDEDVLGTMTSAAVVLVPCSSTTPAALVIDGTSACEETDGAEYTGIEEVSGTDTAGAADVATGAGLAGLTPHSPIGLFPGSLGRTPKITSSTGQTMLQLVEGSLRPPIRPGHLSIPLSPESQLSMICCRVATSQPEMKSACRE